MLKFLLILSSIILSSMGLAKTQEEWFKEFAHIELQEFFCVGLIGQYKIVSHIPLDTLTRTGNIVRYWDYAINNDPTVYYWDLHKNLHEIDCARHTFKTLSIQEFNKGNLLASHSMQTEEAQENYIVPGSAAEYASNFVCTFTKDPNSKSKFATRIGYLPKDTNILVPYVQSTIEDFYKRNLIK